MTSRVLLILLALAAFLGAPAPAGAAETLAEIRETALAAAKGDDSGARRSAQIVKLPALDTAEAAAALVEVLTALGEKNDALVRQHDTTVKQYEAFKGYAYTDDAKWALKERLQKMLVDEESKLASDGLVRDAVVPAVAKMTKAGALSVLEKAATASPLTLVRTILWAGLARNEDVRAPDVAKKALKDADPKVRLAALSAFAERKDPGVVDLVAKALLEEAWPLRQAAVRALAAQGDVRAVPPLISAMANEDGALLEDYASALAALTGVTLGTYPDSWRKWYEEHRKELEAKGAKGGQKIAASGPPPSPIDYYGVKTLSKKVLFILDISGSMKDPLNPKGPTTGDNKEHYSGPKIEVAKQVLLKAIRNLSDKSTFDVLLFNHQFTDVLEGMKVANKENKDRAELAVEAAQPVGATWTYGVMREAFEIAKRCGNGYAPGVDTIFLLSDGAPTDDKTEGALPMEPGIILDAVQDWNRDLRITIHTIAIDPQINGNNFIVLMRGLANRNRGTYTPIGSE